MPFCYIINKSNGKTANNINLKFSQKGIGIISNSVMKGSVANLDGYLISVQIDHLSEYPHLHVFE